MASELRKTGSSRYSNSGSTPIYFNTGNRESSFPGGTVLNRREGRYSNSGQQSPSGSAYVQGSAAPALEPGRVRRKAPVPAPEPEARKRKPAGTKTGTARTAASSVRTARTSAAPVRTAGSAAPVYEPEKIRKAKEDYVARGRAAIEQKARARRLSSREYSPVQVTVIMACLALILVTVTVYMVSLAGVRTSRTRVENLKLDYSRLSAGNTLTEAQIRDNIDYTEVYRYAIETLGMGLPGKQQVVTYGRGTQEYVTKGVDIPNE
ncbi:MAG: hypothetical protein J6Z23_03515 [Lachnospiraceae bacterium]|nr:hypothetical protein [Lachnospiraceae bacterium]